MNTIGLLIVAGILGVNILAEPRPNGLGFSPQKTPPENADAIGIGLSSWWIKENNTIWGTELDIQSVGQESSPGGLSYKLAAPQRVIFPHKENVSVGVVRRGLAETDLFVKPFWFASTHVHYSTGGGTNDMWATEWAAGLGVHWQPFESLSLWVRKPVALHMGNGRGSRIRLSDHRATVVLQW